MTDPWYKSYRVYSAIFAVLAGTGAGASADISQEDIRTITEAVSAISGAASAFFAIYSKYREGKKGAA